MTPFTSIPNFRELGGYVMTDGKTIRPHLLLRGGYLSSASDEELNRLSNDYHLSKIFDFRTEAEVRHEPDREVKGAQRIWLPAIDPETEKKAEQSLPKEAYRNLTVWLCSNASNPLYQQVASRLYTDMIMNEYTQLQYTAFLQTIVNTPEGAVYWHCSQGKDRTGLAACFLLAALGADRELILYDYNLSYEAYRPLVDKMLAQVYANGGGEAEAEVIKTFIGVNVKYFIAGLDLIDKKFGSLLGYVKSALCLSDNDIQILKNRYLI